MRMLSRTEAIEEAAREAVELWNAGRLQEDPNPAMAKLRNALDLSVDSGDWPEGLAVPDPH